MPEDRPERIEIFAPDGIGEVSEGTDLTELVVAAVPDLADGDILVVTSKIVSKAEGRTATGTREEALAGETVRVVARRGPTSIVVNRLGLVMAAAGIDASNVTEGTVLLLPHDPDATARGLRERLHATTGRNVAVLVTDTAGRAWRTGQIDLAIGAAGLDVSHSYQGRTDDYGNPLVVTEPAVADEIASAADLVKGKLTGRPLAVLRGLGNWVLPTGEHGPGAQALQRPATGDLFALGAREAVVVALAGEDATPFGEPAPIDDLLEALSRLDLVAQVEDEQTLVVDTPDERLAVLGHAFGWRCDVDSQRLRRL